MTGLSRTTGQAQTANQHLSQSIADILTTPVGSRVMRREYGCLLSELIDQPVNSQTIITLYAACVSALFRWEPRIRLSRIQLTATQQPGRFELEIQGTAVSTGEALDLRLPLSMGAAA